jgi:hypothetical protein
LSDDSDVKSAVRGLATVAMLKVNFDSGRDHLSMFEPFVIDTICGSSVDTVNLEPTRKQIFQRHQLLFPLHTLRTLLERARRDGYLSREGGQYLRTDKRPERGDVVELRQKVEDKQREIADALRDYASKRGLPITTPEDALGLILNFLEQYQVSLVLGESIDPEVTIPKDPSDDQGADFSTRVTAYWRWSQKMVH